MRMPSCICHHCQLQNLLMVPIGSLSQAALTLHLHHPTLSPNTHQSRSVSEFILYEDHVQVKTYYICLFVTYFIFQNILKGHL